MNLFRAFVAAVIAIAVAGCGGSSITPNPAVSTAQRVKQDKTSYKKALYVADGNVMKIFSNGSYHQLGVITDGLGGPTGLFMDQLGNLYVANHAGGNVTEYAPGGKSPSFTYSDGMLSPDSVTVDRHGNVYESDYNGYINQYFQGFNSVTDSCPKPEGVHYPLGLAVDANGDLFASYSGGGLYEYSGGLANCKPTHLDAMGHDGTVGLVLDSNNNLVASARSGAAAVDVIAPPYSTVTRTIGTISAVDGIALNKKNKLLFMAYPSEENVSVYDYQTGTLLKVLDAAYGISAPHAVVDAPNAVY